MQWTCLAPLLNPLPTRILQQINCAWKFPFIWLESLSDAMRHILLLFVGLFHVCANENQPRKQGTMKNIDRRLNLQAKEMEFSLKLSSFISEGGMGDLQSPCLPYHTTRLAFVLVVVCLHSSHFGKISSIFLWWLGGGYTMHQGKRLSGIHGVGYSKAQLESGLSSIFSLIFPIFSVSIMFQMAPLSMCKELPHWIIRSGIVFSE